MSFGASAKKPSFCLMDRQQSKGFFFVNMEVETCNMKEDTVVAHMIVCQGIGWNFECAFIKRLLNAAKSARSRYRLHLDEERNRKTNEMQCQKRKAAEEDIQQLKKKKENIG